jgi:hypothetical protein
VTARIYLGRGGALLAVAGFVAIRGFLAIMVGGVWEPTTPHFPLYVVEALVVEAVFARAGGRSPVATGARRADGTRRAPGGAGRARPRSAPARAQDDVPGALSLVAYLVVAAIAAALIALIAWALLRLEGAAERRPHAPRAGGRSPVGEPELVRNRIKAISQHHRNIC